MIHYLLFSLVFAFLNNFSYQKLLAISVGLQNLLFIVAFIIGLDELPQVALT
jgi:hypothetical protein